MNVSTKTAFADDVVKTRGEDDNPLRALPGIEGRTMRTMGALMNEFSIKSLLEHIYWYAIGELQQVDAVEAFADELERLAKCLHDDKAYRPDLAALGWPAKPKRNPK